jgi:hypothetical protein
MALNFVTKLSLFKEPITEIIYNFIIIVTDRLTKYAYFISYLESSSAENLAYIFYKYIIANHRFSQRIINNRDKLFISRFWKSLIDLSEIHYKLSTAYHPQTDRQTKRLNQTIKQYLRCYVNYQ